MPPKRTRRVFDAQYKIDTCEKIRKQGLTIAEVCRDEGLTYKSVSDWLKQYDAEREGKAGIGIPLSAEMRRIRELEHENKRLRGDVDILKKAMTCFIKPNA